MEEEKEVINYVAGVPIRKNGLYLVTFVLVDHNWQLVEKVRSMILTLDFDNHWFFASHSQNPNPGKFSEARTSGSSLLFDVCNLKDFFELEVAEQHFPIHTNTKPRQGEASFIRFEYLKQYQEPEEICHTQKSS